MLMSCTKIFPNVNELQEDFPQMFPNVNELQEDFPKC